MTEQNETTGILNESRDQLAEMMKNYVSCYERLKDNSQSLDADEREQLANTVLICENSIFSELAF